MRFRTQSEKINDWVAARPETHTWFAWFPVGVGDGSLIWLEKVERRRYWVYNGYYGKKKSYLYWRIEDEV